jgi:hypothetical protein
MRISTWALLIGAVLAATVSLAGKPARVQSRHIINVTTAAQLANVLHGPLDDTTIRLAPGIYEFTVDTDIDSFGVLLSGHRVRLEGMDADSTRIVAHSPLITFKNCVDCGLDHISITVGDGDGRIYAMKSSVEITNCVITSGVTGNRASLLTLEQNEITLHKTGIEICDDGHAVIRNNLVEGPADSNSTSGLVGVKVGCTAQAVVERNHIVGTQYGIAIMEDAIVGARFNLIENITGRGITIESSFSQPRVTVESNVVYRCGTAGIAVDEHPRKQSKETLGRVTSNIVVDTGKRPRFGRPGAIVRLGVPEGFVISDNTCYDNAPSKYSIEHDVPREMFWRARRPWTRTYRNTPVGVDGRHKFYESAFLDRYGRWAN